MAVRSVRGGETEISLRQGYFGGWEYVIMAGNEMSAMGSSYPVYCLPVSLMNAIQDVADYYPGQRYRIFTQDYKGKVTYDHDGVLPFCCNCGVAHTPD